ncbi:MAG: hypothetical protein AB9869_30755 [Verrucomicrobiia bacterium]
MTTMKAIGMVGALGISLAAGSALAQAASGLSHGTPIFVETQLAAAAPGQGGSGGADGKPDENPGRGVGRGNDSAPQDHPAAPGKDKSTEDKVKEFKKAEDKHLQEVKRLQSEFKNATKQRREEIRNLLREKNRDFVEQQKKRRDEIRERMAQLKEEIKEHKDLIDEAQEGKGKRKGGED